MRILALLVDFFDPEAHVAALNRLLDDPVLRQSLAASAQQKRLTIHLLKVCLPGPVSLVWSSAPRCSLASGHIDEADIST